MNCLQELEVEREELVQSVISKMNYACDNPYCRFRNGPYDDRFIKQSLAHISASLNRLENMVEFKETKPIQTVKPYKRKQRKLNNSLHSGDEMKRTLYDSQNPQAQIRSGKQLNYDRLYAGHEGKIKRTRAMSPEGKSKIKSIIDRDRLRHK